jgi:hypothetical protein
MLADDTLGELAEIDGWSIDGVVAIFRPRRPAGALD